MFPGFSASRPKPPHTRIPLRLRRRGVSDRRFILLVLPYCNTECMNLFLAELSKAFPDDFIVLPCDGASWHTSKGLEIPQNIRLVQLPPATPEMNPMEQVWEEIREKGFRNESFATLEKVVDRLCDTIVELAKSTIRSITGRKWILECF